MDDNQILARGGDEHDIEAYAKANGADLTEEDVKNHELIKTLKMIAEDAENDAKNFDGQPFTGKTVGTYLGNHGASISALAEIMIELIQANQNK
jgi:hypothetical protein